MMGQDSQNDPSSEAFIEKIIAERRVCTKNMIAFGNELYGKCETDAQRAEVMTMINELRELL